MSERPTGGRTWATLSASTIGSVHVRDSLPLQDAVLTWSENESGRAVVAVADGHGHRLHFRSDMGAALATVSAVEEMRRALPHLDAPDADPEQVEKIVASAAAATVDTWTAKVRHHLDANPWSPSEMELGAASDPLRAYGTTLLVAAAVRDQIVCWQIGDGDIVLVSTRGEASHAVADDPDLDGLHTTSLCQPRPLDSLRISVLDARVEDVALVFLTTDGFSGPQTDTGGWWRQTGEQLLDFSRSRGLAWVREQLPGWLEEPALVGGDDVTMAVMVTSGVDGIERPDLATTVEVPEG